MIAHPSSSWQDLNQQYLANELERIRQILHRYIEKNQNNTFQNTLQNTSQNTSQAQEDSSNQSNYSAPYRSDLDAFWQSSQLPPPAVVSLCHGFGLSAFERDLLLLGAGVELSGSLAHLCATAQGNPHLIYATFSLVLAALPLAHWSAIVPANPLRHWRLIEVNPGESLVQSRLRIDERILHYLNGISYLDDRLQAYVTPLHEDYVLPPSHQQVSERMAQLWSDVSGGAVPTVIQICGAESEDNRSIALAACHQLGIELYQLQVTNLPASGVERDALGRLWERETILNPSALFINCDNLDSGESLRHLLPLLNSLQSPLVLSGREPLRLSRPTLRLDVAKPTAAEQRYLWQVALETQPTLQPAPLDLDPILAQFNLSAPAINAICTELQLQDPQSTDSASCSDAPTSLWHLCRSHARSQLDDLAQRIQPIARWQDLVLPDEQSQTLKEIAAQVRQRTTVYETWEFAVRGANGLGISALFAGASGTGKTMAAEVIANELQLDLYRIDLSQVVSKYIGETEKNLRRVFDAAEAGGAILLFDEADALFGKRSEVKDAHDRYANIEVSYLLQRMEAYRGLAILTTNFRNALDPAFLRRIRFVVLFPFPDLYQRRDIWQRMFPSKLPTSGINFEQLARLNVAGGNIRNIALNAAFLAADTGEPLQMKHLLRSAQTEYGKLEKTLTDAEVGGWI